MVYEHAARSYDKDIETTMTIRMRRHIVFAFSLSLLSQCPCSEDSEDPDTQRQCHDARSTLMKDDEGDDILKTLVVKALVVRQRRE